jgi:chlorite dismutase
MTKKENKVSERQFSHYGFFRFTDSYWQQTNKQRQSFLKQLTKEIPEIAERVYLYTIFPTRPEVDFMIWSALKVDNPRSVGDFFNCANSRISQWRKFLQPVNTLWGFTRPSVYASGKSAQELDPFDPTRQPYLVVYPFVKTAEWYLMGREARQGMMNEHIRIGRQYPEITQLLLYSTGLQDQEFVVVYETDDLAHFSGLVSALRDTEGRKYTLRDTPIYTAIHRPAREALLEWA